jgi:uncharacterized pyridoxal phosphate-containing UPF0001 family protein
LPVLLECNVSGEATKYGWLVDHEARLPAFLADVIELLKLPSIKVCGLMTMAPDLPDPEMTRPFFRRLQELLNRLRIEFPVDHYPQAAWQELSMGMSGDYAIAIQEGATLVRIGAAIMGPRSPNPTP